MSTLWLLVWYVICWNVIAASESDSIMHFATKTAYRNRHREESKFLSDDLFLRDNCKLTHVSQVTRHGSRSPSKKQLRKLERLHARLMASFHAKEFLPSLLNGWKSKFKADTDKLLSPVGHEELFTMGQRFYTRYSSLMSMSGKTLQFISSSLSRAKESALSFLKGLPTDFHSFPIDENEKLVRYFAYCPRYQSAVKKNKTALAEYYKFRNGPEMESVVKHIRERFQLTDIDLSTDDLELMFINCGFEVANNISSPKDSWCQMFRSKDAAVIEYLQDLKQFWRKSYPYKLNYLQSCPLVSAILDNLRRAAKENEHGAVLYFGHAETLIPILTALGLFRDADYLRASNMAAMLTRRFRTAAIAPFAGNVALELFRCTQHEREAQLVVRPLVNERPVFWDLCGASFCPYEQAVAHLAVCAPSQHDQADVCAKHAAHDEL